VGKGKTKSGLQFKAIVKENVKVSMNDKEIQVLVCKLLKLKLEN